MSDAGPQPAAPSQEAVLRRLFLTLFLRGRASRGLKKEAAPKSIAHKLALTLVFYALFGAFALLVLRQPVFAVSIYLHAMTFIFLGMFVASSAGEILFNKDEADLLLHRPVRPEALLRAKVRVLVEVSLWIAVAFNFVGFAVGWHASDGGWRYLAAHALSLTLEALFCTGSVVLTYQLVLRWCGRERLEGLMTTAQVLVSVGAVMAGQIVPRLFAATGMANGLKPGSWWMAALPPAWFAGLDDLLCGQRSPVAWTLSACALLGTGAVAWIAFGKLAHSYEAGLQTLQEARAAAPSAGGARRRWLDVLVGAPPLRWWLRDPVARASFLLCSAYLVRDRDVKLRVYPGLAPLLVMPFVMLFTGHRSDGESAIGGFNIAFAGGFLGLLPTLGLQMLQYSSQWQASDLFRTAPIRGIGPLCHGARCAALLLLVPPLVAIAALAVLLLHGDRAQLLLLLPGAISAPLLTLLPAFGGNLVPLSLPPEDAKAAGRGVAMIAMMLVAGLLAGLVAWSWSAGWFAWLLLAETAIVAALCVALHRKARAKRWSPLE